MPRNLSPEMALTKFLSSLQTRFDAVLQDVALWNIVKEKARVVFTHPGSWNNRLARIRVCIQDAGWLDYGKRELIFKTEEESLVARLYEFELGAPYPFYKDVVVVTESGPSAVVILRAERNIERPWKIDRRWKQERCNAGFAVAFDHAKISVPTRYGVEYRLSYRRQQLEERDGANEPMDINFPMSKANEVRSKSIASLVEKMDLQVPSGANICFGGNYIGTDEVRDLVLGQLHYRGLETGLNSGPPGSDCLTNKMCVWYNCGALFSYGNDLREALPVCRQVEAPESNEIEFGGYWWSQHTPNGEPPDISVFVTPALEADLQPPPSPAIIDKIREWVRNCYIQIRLWKAAETSVGHQPVVDKMVPFFELYIMFLQNSLVDAELGHSVSAECETLCNALGSGIPANQFQEKVRGLQSKVKEALEGAMEMAYSFRSLRLITKGIRKTALDLLADSDSDSIPEDHASPTNENSQPQMMVSFEQKLVLSIPSVREAILDVQRILAVLEGDADKVANWWKLVQSRFHRLGRNANGLSSTDTLRISSPGADWGKIGQSYAGFEDTLKSLLAVAQMQYSSPAEKTRPTGSQMEGNLKDIRESAVKCYNQIRPWRYSTSSNPLVAKVVVKNMQQCFAKYESFLQSSLMASESGYSASSKCESFFRHLASGHVAEEERVADVKTTVMGALNTAEKMAESFRSVRVAIAKAQEFTSAMVEGLALFNVPIDNVTLPLFDTDNPLPSPTITVSGTPQNAQTTESHLQQAIITLDTFNNYINPIVNWWLEARSVLTDLEKKASQPKMGALMAKLTTAKWESIKDEYVRYQMTVHPLLDPKVLISV